MNKVVQPSWKHPPSPISAITVNFYLLNVPIASGMDLPCSPLKPYILILSAPLPLQPMSNDIKASDGDIFKSEAFYCSMYKVSHPGHHVGRFVEL